MKNALQVHTVARYCLDSSVTKASFLGWIIFCELIEILKTRRMHCRLHYFPSQLLYKLWQDRHASLSSPYWREIVRKNNEVCDPNHAGSEERSAEVIVIASQKEWIAHSGIEKGWIWSPPAPACRYQMLSPDGELHTRGRVLLWGEDRVILVAFFSKVTIHDCPLLIHKIEWNDCRAWAACRGEKLRIYAARS